MEERVESNPMGDYKSGKGINRIKLGCFGKTFILSDKEIIQKNMFQLITLRLITTCHFANNAFRF